MALEAVLMTTVQRFNEMVDKLRPLIKKSTKELLGDKTLNTAHQVWSH